MQSKLLLLVPALLLSACNKPASTQSEELTGCASLPSDDRLLATFRTVVPDAQRIVGVTCGEMVNPPGIGANVIEQQAQTRQEFRVLYFQDRRKWFMTVPILSDMLIEVK